LQEFLWGRLEQFEDELVFDLLFAEQLEELAGVAISGLAKVTQDEGRSAAETRNLLDITDNSLG
jgi:hypothetical protein